MSDPDKQFWYGFYASFLSLRLKIISRVKLFNRLEDASKDTYLIKEMCKELIILDMAKVTSPGKNDQTGFKNIKEWLLKVGLSESKQQIQKLEKKVKIQINKININRDKLIAHLDFFKEPYTELGFSENEVDRLYEFLPDSDEEAEKIIADAKKKLVVSNKERQRYGWADLKEDFKIFNEILIDLSEIYRNINSVVVKSTKNTL